MSLFGSQGGGLGTGMGLGLLIMPISIAALIFRRPAGPIRKLITAKALSPETARRAQSVGIPREYVLRPYARLGVAKRLNDGRWYVDQRRDRLVRLGLCAAIALLALALALGVWMTWGELGDRGGSDP